MQLGKSDLLLLSETNIPDAVYCHNRLWYNIVCSQVVGTTSGLVLRGVGLFMRERPEEWIVKSTRFHRPNVVICKIGWKVSQVESV